MDDDTVVPDEVLERKKRETDQIAADLDATIADLDVKLDRVLKK
jgi:hypothetical protein